MSFQDIPLPLEHTPKAAVRSGSLLCLADPKVYSILDLSSQDLTEMLPILQVDVNSDDLASSSIIAEPIMAVIPGEQPIFVICTRGERHSMGVFVDGNGDPVKGIILWDEVVTSLGMTS